MILIPQPQETCDALRLRALAVLLPGEVVRCATGEIISVVERHEALLPGADDRTVMTAGLLRETVGRNGRVTMIEVVKPEGGLR